MYLAEAHLFGVPPFGDIQLPFRDAQGMPRMATVIHGAGGVGKTSLLHVVANTRPGHAAMLPATPTRAHNPYAVCEWSLGDDDPQRPHPLVVVTPNARLSGTDEEIAMQRREQTMFDRQTRGGGFAFFAISSARWFSRQPVTLHAPARTVANYDVRAGSSFDDANRADLTRETKQALAYASISAALAPIRQGLGNRAIDTRKLGEAMHDGVDAIVKLGGFRYLGVDPTTLEPTFGDSGGQAINFGRLPTRARHLVAFVALTTRVLWAAYPGRDPRDAEGVVAIDDVDLHQDAPTLERLVPQLRAVLPRVQWILTTSAPNLAAACNNEDVLALRRLPEHDSIELYTGEQARTH